ncbi:MAG: hypothetical protein HY070_04155, partial [Chloroflexi bacterium]|nr:hypothetical protein [Chloroflexota bacterium]
MQIANGELKFHNHLSLKVIHNQGGNQLGTKQDVIAEIFKRCKATGTWEFDNDLVRRVSAEKGFANPFDVTKIDNSSLLPTEMKHEDYFFVHLGLGGRHRIVKGIKFGFHNFEPIAENEVIPWKYRR